MDRINWMANVADHRKLSWLSLPGTHDSAADASDLPGAGFTQTQAWSIERQLANGVRYFDFRARIIDDTLQMHHGPVYLGLSLDTAFRALFDFVQQYPSETLLVSLREEHTRERSTMSFAEGVQRTLLDPYRHHFFEDARLPTLAEARGKIILMPRFNGCRLGLRTYWQDKRTFDFDSNGQRIHVQDVYGTYTALDFTQKRKEVSAFVDATRHGSPDDFFINFLSLSGALTPYHGACGDAFTQGTNRWFVDHYQGLGKARLGVIVADYIDDDNGRLLDLVIRSNLFHR